MSHVDRHYKKNYLPPPLNAEKVRKWGFGPIHMKGKRNWKDKSMPLYPPFPIKYQHPHDPSFFGLAMKGECLYI